MRSWKPLLVSAMGVVKPFSRRSLASSDAVLQSANQRNEGINLRIRNIEMVKYYKEE